ncbi:hypothetical protein J3R83DRAFT_7151 [Lanmaoa asiatica]|nr:hypothetical protein J3R83DRAFT_7151 [Lanmaoa asiatica]
MRALDWRVGPQIDVGMPNQSVFISGFKIAIREGILGKKRVEVEVDTPPVQSRSVKFSNRGNSPSHSRAGNLWRRLVSRGGNSGGRKSAEQTLPAARSTEDPRTTSLSAPQSDDAGAIGDVTINHVPEPLQSLHPSDIVNRYLLTKEPLASVAITHDTQWSILFEKGILKPEDLGHDGRLERIVSQNYRLVSQGGAVIVLIVRFTMGSDSSIRLTDIDDAAREAWKEDRLDDAEEILSRQLIRRTGSDHSAFANRALIRARLHHWNTALRDAETSIDIQPSVVAHVAKGFALFGQEKYGLAVEAFNVALRQCDVHDRDVVLLIKSIVLFEVNYHAESMASIADSIEGCPVEVKLACSSAEMYVRLATLATKNEDYDRALQLLSRSQSLGPFRAVPDLKIISLICGWRFDNLQFTIHRQNCEVLYVAGQTDEALESLRAMTHNLGEDVRTRKGNAEWITAFTQQCLRSLESLGDNAVTSQNYTEAITRYSMALGMGPVNRESILIKRSKAYAAAHVWDDALKDAVEAINLNPLSPLGYERKHEALQGMGRYDEAVRTFNDMFSILERSADPRTLHLRSRYSNPSQSIVRLEREGVVGAHNLTARPLEQQHNVQLGKLIAQITALREQLGSDVTTAERDRVLHDQLTDVLNTILRFPHEQGATISREDDRNRATGSMPAPNIVVESIQEPVPRQEPPGALTTPSEHVDDIQVQRYPSVHASPEIFRPVPAPTAVKVPSGDARRSLTLGGPSRGHHHQDLMTHPVDSPPPDGDSQLHRPEHLNDDRRSRSSSSGERRGRGRYYIEREQHDPPSGGHQRQLPRTHRRYHGRSDDSSVEHRRRRRGRDDYAGHSEDTQRYDLSSPRRRRERREQTSSSDSGDESSDTNDILQRRPRRRSDPSENQTGVEQGDVSTQPRSQYNTSGTLPHTAPPTIIAPAPMPAPSMAIPRFGTEGSSDKRSLQGPTLHGVPPEDQKPLEASVKLVVGTKLPSQEWLFPPPAPMNVHVQQPAVWAQPPIYTVMPPGPTLAQLQAPLHDTLFEMLRDQRLAHRESIDQQQELTRQIRSLSEWLMREMQDRLTELRGMTARTYPYPPGEPGQPNPQPYHGVGSAGPVGPVGMPWSTPWYQQPQASSWPSYSATPFGGSPFNVNPNPTPFIPPLPSPTQQSPYISPPPIVREFGTPKIPRLPSSSKGDDRRPRTPVLSYPRKMSSSVGTSPPLAPKSVEDPEAASSQVQTASNAPLSTLSSRLGAQEYDNPKKSTLGVGDEGNISKASKSGEKRRPGTVTFGEVTYY